MTKLRTPSVDEIIAKIREYYHRDTREWICIKELRIGTGYTGGANRAIDLWAINTYKSKAHKAIAYEIKRSRSDFLRDVKKADKKHRGAKAYSDEFFYVAPEGMIKAEELPPWAGLIEIKPNGWLIKEVEPLPSDKLRPSWNLMCSILRRGELS